jgi:hypothetical protein
VLSDRAARARDSLSSFRACLGCAGHFYFREPPMKKMEMKKGGKKSKPPKMDAKAAAFGKK